MVLQVAGSMLLEIDAYHNLKHCILDYTSNKKKTKKPSSNFMNNLYEDALSVISEDLK